MTNSNHKLTTEGAQADTGSSYINEEFLQQIQLNLRISTTAEDANANNNHVSKVMIQNSQNLSGSIGSMSLIYGSEDNIKRSIGGLRFDGYV